MTSYESYMLVALVFLVALTVYDPDMRLYEASWAVALWPLALFLLALAMLGRLLHWLGFRARYGRPKPGLGWSADRVRPRDPEFPRHVVGLWAASPWRAVSVWWVSPWRRRL